MNTDLIKAYRAARRCSPKYAINGAPHRGGINAGYALETARDSLQKVAAAEKRYRDEATAREALDDAAANGAPIGRDRLLAATDAEVKARSALANEKHRAGLFDSDGPPCIWPAVSYDPESGLAYLSDEDGGGAFRNIRDAHDVTRLDHSGWFIGPYGEEFKDDTGLCIGVVAQFRGRAGRAVYVAGYRFGGTDAGPTFDLSETYDDEDDASRAADSLAEHAAEREREYQCAWRAGDMWARAAEDVSFWKRQVREYIETWKAERKDHGRVAPAFDSLVRKEVSNLLERICESRFEMRGLRDGVSDELSFDLTDSNTQAAFCDGADLTRFPR